MEIEILGKRVCHRMLGQGSIQGVADGKVSIVFDGCPDQAKRFPIKALADSFTIEDEAVRSFCRNVSRSEQETEEFPKRIVCAAAEGALECTEYPRDYSPEFQRKLKSELLKIPSEKQIKCFRVLYGSEVFDPNNLDGFDGLVDALFQELCNELAAGKNAESMSEYQCFIEELIIRYLASQNPKKVYTAKDAKGFFGIPKSRERWRGIVELFADSFDQPVGKVWGSLYNVTTGKAREQIQSLIIERVTAEEDGIDWQDVIRGVQKKSTNGLIDQILELQAKKLYDREQKIVRIEEELEKSREKIKQRQFVLEQERTRRSADSFRGLAEPITHLESLLFVLSMKTEVSVEQIKDRLEGITAGIRGYLFNEGVESIGKLSDLVEQREIEYDSEKHYTEVGVAPGTIVKLAGLGFRYYDEHERPIIERAKVYVPEDE